ncbi:CCDC90 family protein [Methylobacterium sp. E-065]|uniref:coiled-coil domain-containing protein n=1 Tax=Methylobacterium sp. E-065 TaxID=2836583 RepID=UPI001FBB4ABE|nr:coiled-coil domain-containing protein [Methylobacterium sp. E-065]MCJ2017304.1 CCDC90 family protein [Methylobacterium sp. E-065]
MLDSMSLVSLDTLAIARKLQAAGFSDVQADAVTGVIRDAREGDLTTLVTKSDLSAETALIRSDLSAETALIRSDLKAETAHVRSDLTAEIALVRSDLSTEMALVRSDLKAEIAVVRSEFRTEIADTRYEILKWVLSAIGFQTIVVVGAIVALTKGLH